MPIYTFPKRPPTPRPARSLVLYLAYVPGPDRQDILTPDGELIYIRTELHACDADTALDRAQCREHESVLNSVPLV